MTVREISENTIAQTCEVCRYDRTLSLDDLDVGMTGAPTNADRVMKQHRTFQNVLSQVLLRFLAVVCQQRVGGDKRESRVKQR